MPHESRLPDPPQVGFLPIPVVPVRDEPAWEYRRQVRNLRTEEPPTEAELNALGQDGWELAGMYTDLPFLHLFFKRLTERR